MTFMGMICLNARREYVTLQRHVLKLKGILKNQTNLNQYNANIISSMRQKILGKYTSICNSMLKYEDCRLKITG